MKITVRYFGAAAEKADTREEILELADGVALRDAVDACREQHAGLTGFPAGAISFVLNQVRTTDGDTTLSDGDTLAWLPPVGGGLPDSDPVTVIFSDTPLSCDAAFAAVQDPRFGGNALFIGTTRSPNQGREVEKLSYEIYHEVAAETLKRIGAELLREYGVGRIAFFHREGEVPPGEISVIIAVSSGHRDAAFRAGRAAIDRLKEEAEIWKKEVFEGGELWVENPEARKGGLT